MKTLKSLLMLCAGLSFCACNSDNEPQLPEGKGKVTVTIANPATRAISEAIVADGDFVNGNITLKLTHDGSEDPVEVTLNWDGTKYTASTGTVTPSGNNLLYTFYDIDTPRLLTASMHGGVPDYSSIAITGGTPELQVEPNVIPVYGETDAFNKTGNIINNGDDYVEWRTTVQMTIPVARLEINILVSQLENAFADFASVELAGAYLDNVKLTGSAAASNLYLKYDNSSTRKASAGLASPYAVLCDNNFTAAGDDESLWQGAVDTSAQAYVNIWNGTTAVAKLPANNKYFAYNFYPGATPKFKLCLKVTSSDNTNPIPAIQYAIVTFVEPNGTEGTKDIDFLAQNIYRVTNLTLDGSRIQVDEDGEDLSFALVATVERAQWTVNTSVEGTWD